MAQAVARAASQQCLEPRQLPEPVDLFAGDEVSEHVLAGDHVPQVRGP